VAKQILAAATPSPVEGDADTRANAQLAAGDPSRLPERSQQPLRDGDRMRLVRAVDQDGKLVAAEARQGVAGPELGVEPLRDDLEQLVPGVVAQAVVDLLEPVEVDQQDGE
jgi:hypothetical protein